MTKEILNRISEYFPAVGSSAESDLLSLAADEAIVDLDGLFLFLRKEPTVLSRLVVSQTGRNGNLINGNGTTSTTK